MGRKHFSTWTQYKLGQMVFFVFSVLRVPTGIIIKCPITNISVRFRNRLGPIPALF
jgi:hypothetical protein